MTADLELVDIPEKKGGAKIWCHNMASGWLVLRG